MLGYRTFKTEPTLSTTMGDSQPPSIPDDDVDVAALLADRLGEETFTSAEESTLRWKVDLRLVPILWFNVTLAAVDKVSTSTAALYGMKTDCHLTGSRYAWVGSAFYFGYLFFSLPASQILQRLPIAKTMFAAQLVWGAILIVTGFANSFASLVTLRVLLGALESPIVPGNLLVISMWYTRTEQPVRTGLMYTGLSVLITGPIGWGIGFISDKHYAWPSMFWITGALTILWAFVVGALLPDNPARAKFIGDREKSIAAERLREDQTGIENKTFKQRQLIEAFIDPKTWLLFGFNICVSIPNGGLTNFAPLIIKGLGYSSQRSVLLTMPVGIVQTISSYVCNFGVYFCLLRYPRLQLRGVWCLFGLLVGTISAVFLYTLPLDNYHGRLAALYMSYFYLGPYILSLGLVTANTAGHTKKVTVNAIIFIAYCTSNIIAPQFFKEEQAPRYTLGMGAILGSYVGSVLFLSLYMIWCGLENAKRDRRCPVRYEGKEGRPRKRETDFKDLTDRENLHFRYVW